MQASHLRSVHLEVVLAEGFHLPPLTPELLDGLGSVLNPGLSSCIRKALWHTVWVFSSACVSAVSCTLAG